MRKFLLSIFVALSLSCESKIQVVEDDALNEDKNFSVFGNSISTYEGYIPSDYLTWFTPSKMKVEETWWYQVGESMGWELCNNSSWSGSRVAYDKDWDYNSYFISPYRLNNLSAKGTPDNILVLAGVNDWRWNISSLGTIESLDSTAFCGAYNLMLKRLKQLYPQANIYCISILPIREKGNTEETINSQGWSIAEANVCIKHICTNEGVTFFNMQESLLFFRVSPDTIKKREVERLISFCKNKLHKSLETEVSFFAISPYAANEERIKASQSDQKNNETEKTNADYGLSQFQEFRNQLLQILLRNRGIVQSKKLNKQITAFVTNMQDMLKDDIKHFEVQIAEYNKNIIPTDSPLWEQWHKKAKLDFKNSSKDVKASMENGVSDIIGKLKKDLFESIDSCSDNEELKKFLESGVQRTVSGYESKFSDYINNKIYKPLNKSADDILAKLDKEYKTNLKKIENIFEFVSGSAMGSVNQSSDNGSLISYSSGTRSLSEAFESEENKKIGGGLATGIAVSMMIPGAGWVAAGVLALVGGVLGAMFGPSLQERKSKSKDQILEYMDRIHSGFSQKVKEMYQEYQKDISSRLETSLKHKKESYLGLINSYNDNIQRIQSNFKTAQEQIDTIVVSLNNYQNQINSVIGKLE